MTRNVSSRAGQSMLILVCFLISIIGMSAQKTMVKSNEINDTYEQKNDCSSFDKIPPVVFCQDAVVYLDHHKEIEINPQILDNGSFDLCTGISFSASQTVFDCDDIGMNPITLIVQDENGNSSSCEAIISVFDTPFQFQCPADMTVAANRWSCSAQVVWGEPIANCSVSLSSNFKSGDIFPLGKTTVVYEIQDLNSVHQICTFEINVINDLSIKAHQKGRIKTHQNEQQEICISIDQSENSYSIIWDEFLQNEKFKLKDLPSGNHFVQVTDANGCFWEEYVQMPLSKWSNQLNHSSSPQTNEINLLMTGGKPPYLLDWYLDDVGDENESATSNSIGGIYTVSVVDKNGYSDFLSVSEEALDFKCGEGSYKIYPSSESGNFSLIFKNCLEKIKIEIFDLKGTRISVLETSEIENEIELEALSEGIYFFKTTSEKGSLVKFFEVLKE